MKGGWLDGWRGRWLDGWLDGRCAERNIRGVSIDRTLNVRIHSVLVSEC